VGPNGVFYGALGAVVAVLLAGILVLSALVTASGPRVRHVTVHNPDGSEVPVSGQGLTVVFDRPVGVARGSTLESEVEIRPEADFALNHRRGRISLTFEENLRSDTEYVLEVGPGLVDVSGIRMDVPHAHEFETEEPAFTYLERNYEPGAPDRVAEREPISGRSRTLLEAPQIGYFARNGDHLAVTTPKTEYTDELRVVDLADGEVREVEVPGAVRIESLRFSPAEDRFVFVTRVIAGPEADESFREGHEGRLYAYDVGNAKLEPVDTLSEGGNVESARFSRDGQALLYRTFDGTYYLTDAAGSAPPTPLGSYADSGGFDRSNTRISFRAKDGNALVYDAEEGETRDLPFAEVQVNGSTPTFLNNGDGLAYREGVEISPGEMGSRVVVSDADGDEAVVAEPPPEAYFYDEPVTSLDDRYVLVESASRAGDMDYYPANPQPEDATLLLYDRSKKEIVDEVRGVDPVWSR
jgi:dipeptidyl aminopeptidase/acylaminoacyl peptidase